MYTLLIFKNKIIEFLLKMLNYKKRVFFKHSYFSHNFLFEIPEKLILKNIYCFIKNILSKIIKFLINIIKLVKCQII